MLMKFSLMKRKETCMIREVNKLSRKVADLEAVFITLWIYLICSLVPTLTTRVVKLARTWSIN